jgi:RNA polymerase sigma-70 factor (ECF subfamily)
MQAMERSAPIPFSIESAHHEPAVALQEPVAALSEPAAVLQELDIALLVETYSRTLFRVAYSVLRSRTDAEDIVQEVFIRVLTHRNSLQSVREMRVWLVRIAWNLALDAKRRIRPGQMDVQFVESLVAESVSADELLQQSQTMHTAMREMKRLPRGEREVLLLSAVDELGSAEMASVLGRSESAVRALLFRARTRLRERLTAKEARSAQRG